MNAAMLRAGFDHAVSKSRAKTVWSYTSWSRSRGGVKNLHTMRSWFWARSGNTGKTMTQSRTQGRVASRMWPRTGTRV